MLLLGLFLFMVSSASAKICLGSCPHHEVQQNFQTDYYLGRWYEYKRYLNFFEFGTKCVQADYQFNNDTTENDVDDLIEENKHYPLHVKNSAIRTWLFSEKPVSVEGKARFENESRSEGKILVNFNGREGNYWVLKTDYSSYSLVWACANFFVAHLEYAWVLTRDRKPSDSTLHAIKTALKEHGIESWPFWKTDQTGCDH